MVGKSSDLSSPKSPRIQFAGAPSSSPSSPTKSPKIPVAQSNSKEITYISFALEPAK